MRWKTEGENTISIKTMPYVDVSWPDVAIHLAYPIPQDRIRVHFPSVTLIFVG